MKRIEKKYMCSRCLDDAGDGRCEEGREGWSEYSGTRLARL